MDLTGLELRLECKCAMYCHKIAYYHTSQFLKQAEKKFCYCSKTKYTLNLIFSDYIVSQQTVIQAFITNNFAAALVEKNNNNNNNNKNKNMPKCSS